MTDLINRLRGPAPSILAMRDAADEIIRLSTMCEIKDEEIARLKIDLRDYMLAAADPCDEKLTARKEQP